MNWLLAYRSKLRLENKFLLYKTILKPARSNGVELWGSVSNSNVEIIQRHQSKLLRQITKPPWYVSNRPYLSRFECSNSQERNNRIKWKWFVYTFDLHPNYLAINLLAYSNAVSRLKQSTVTYLPSDSFNY